MNKNGKLTPSGFAALMTKGRGKGEEWGKTAQEYINRVVLERLGVEIPDISAKALDWGNEWESYAIARFEELNNVVVEPCGVIQHPELDFVAGTPDGLIGDIGIIEVKCPYNPANHLANLTSNEQYEQYKWQIQGYLWITGRQFCNFVSYHPYFPDHLKLSRVSVGRDEDMISQLHERCVAAELIIQDIIKRL